MKRLLLLMPLMTMLSAAVYAQQTTKSYCVGHFNGSTFNVNVGFVPVECKEAERYAASLIFGEGYESLEKAYDDFKKLWKVQETELPKPPVGLIWMEFWEQYELPGRLGCYRAQAKISGSAQLTGLPQTQSAQMQKKQYLKLASGIDRRFVVDLQSGEVLGLDQIFVPAVAARLKTMFGEDINLYTEDRCLQIQSKAGDGRFIFNKITEGNFTEHFKQLVGWYELKDIDTPEFLRGQAGIETYLEEAGFKFECQFFNEVKMTWANGGKEMTCDTVVVSLIVREDGTPINPHIEKGSDHCDEKKLLELCQKMPKWKPAYKDGQPVTREAFFSIRVRNDIEAKVFDVVEQMPSFAGGVISVRSLQPDGTVKVVRKNVPAGDAGLMKYLSSTIKYPVIAEEHGIQGRVIATFIVERDGSISNVKIVKSVDPSLDKEAIRVLKAMPKWIPGRQNGAPIRVKYTVPVTFRL